MSKEKKKSGKGKWIILTIILIVVAVIIGCGVYVKSTVDRFLDLVNKVPDTVVDVIPPEEADFETEEIPAGETEMAPEDVEWTDVITDLGDDHLLNILLVGQDRREGQGRQRSDSMILCSINTETKEISLVSFLRDLYVQYPDGYAANRLNAAYVFGGFRLLDDTLNLNFGITVDSNVEVDFTRFIEIIDVFGGVDIELTSAEAQIVLGKSEAGMYHLNGNEALTYSRIRKIDSDFYRTGRQRNVIEAVFGKVKQMSLSEMLSALETILPSLSTDMSNSDIISLATELFPLLKDAELNSYRIPADGAYYSTYISGMSVLVPDLNRCCELLKEEYLPLN